MDWPGNYVYVPVWLLMVLCFLASGAVQYGLVGAVKLTLRLTRPRQPRQAAAPDLKVITPAEFKKHHHS